MVLPIQREDYRVWRASFMRWWHLFRPHYDENYLMVSVERCLPGDYKRQLYSELPGGDWRFEKVLAVLDRDQAGLEVVNERKLKREYSELKRASGESLGDFLKKWRQLRARALAAAVVSPAASDWQDLLDAACVSETEEVTMMTTMERERKEYGSKEFSHEAKLQFILGELEQMVKIQELRRDRGAGERAESVAMWADQDDKHARKSKKFKEKSVQKTIGKDWSERQRVDKKKGCFHCGATDHWLKDCQVAGADEARAEAKKAREQKAKGAGKGKGAKGGAKGAKGAGKGGKAGKKGWPFRKA